jgi:hypothetical protein
MNKSAMRILLLTPPLVQVNTPYSATPLLTAFLRARGVDAVQDDLSLRLVLRVFSKEGVRHCARVLRRRGGRMPAGIRHFLAHADGYVRTIECVMGFLQGRDVSAAAAIASRRLLPEGPRFRPLAEAVPAQIFGVLGMEEQARHLASLYLDDLADVIRDGVDPRFEFSRYAEKLAVSLPVFDPLLRALRARPTWVDRMLDDEADACMERNRPDLVALTVPFPGCVYGAFRIAARIKARHPGVRTALGGGYVNTELRGLSDPRVFDFFDFVTLDDGELPLLRIAARVRGRRLPLVRTRVRENGRVVFCDDPRMPVLRHARRPAPAYDGLPLDGYFGMKESLSPMQTLWSEFRWNKLMLAHGCYWHRCAFCDTRLDYIRRYDPAPVDRIVSWIRSSVRQTGCRGFHFTDEAAPPALLDQLSQKLLDKKLSIQWWTNIRFEPSFSRQRAAQMAAAGCLAVTGAIETASEASLCAMRKGIRLDRVARTIRDLSGAGIGVHAYLMYGFPNQDARELADALEYVRQLFAAGILHSAYWHRFALTVHSAIHADPGAFGVRLRPMPPASFARNEAAYVDQKRADYAPWGAGLRKSVYNYMHGVGLDAPLAAWFDGVRVPRPRVPADFVARALRRA